MPCLLLIAALKSVTSIGETRGERKPSCALQGLLKSSAASAAKVRSANSQRTALAAEMPRAAHGHQPYGNWPCVGCARPNERHDPANNGPAQKEIHHKNQPGIGLIAANNRRKEIHQASK